MMSPQYVFTKCWFLSHFIQMPPMHLNHTNWLLLSPNRKVIFGWSTVHTNQYCTKQRFDIPLLFEMLEAPTMNPSYIRSSHSEVRAEIHLLPMRFYLQHWRTGSMTIVLSSVTNLVVTKGFLMKRPQRYIFVTNIGSLRSVQGVTWFSPVMVP